MLSAAKQPTWRACEQRYTSPFQELFGPTSSSLSQPVCRMYSLSKTQCAHDPMPSLPTPTSGAHKSRNNAPISMIFFPLDPNRRPESENSAPGPRSQQSGPEWPKTTSKGCPKQHNMTPHLPWAKTSRVMLARRVSRYKTWLHERTPALQRLMPLTASCHCPKWAYTCHQLTTLILPDESETSHT